MKGASRWLEAWLAPATASRAAATSGAARNEWVRVLGMSELLVLSSGRARAPRRAGAPGRRRRLGKAGALLASSVTRHCVRADVCAEEFRVAVDGIRARESDRGRRA